MAVELQFRTSVLGTLIARAMQRRLRAACLPPLSGVFAAGTAYVDHADVVDPHPEVRPGERPGTAEVPLEVALHPVARPDVLAHPGGVPDGARGIGLVRVSVVAEIALDGTTMTVRPRAAGGWIPDGAGLVEALADGPAFDAWPTFEALGLPRPRHGTLEVDLDHDPVLSVRFDPAGPGCRRLGPGQQWGVFVDARTVEAMAAGEIAERVAGALTATTVSATWAPDAGAARVDVRVTGRRSAPPAAGAAVDATFACDLTLATQPHPALRTIVTPAPDAGPGAPGAGTTATPATGHNTAQGTPPGAQDPRAHRPGGQEPGADRPGADRPGGQDLSAHQPGGQGPGAHRQPGGHEPGADRPGGHEPGADRPGADRPRPPVPAPPPGPSAPSRPVVPPASGRPVPGPPPSRRPAPGPPVPGPSVPGSSVPRPPLPGPGRPPGRSGEVPARETPASGTPASGTAAGGPAARGTSGPAAGLAAGAPPGAVPPTAPHDRHADRPLPRRRIGGATLHHSSLHRDTDGITIGGPVTLPEDPGDEIVQAVVLPFGPPTRFERCSMRPHAGADPDTPAHPGDLFTQAGVELERAGALCDVEVVAPGPWIEPYITRHRVDDETYRIRVRLPAAAGPNPEPHPQPPLPVRLLVRTARGTRLLDLGVPGGPAAAAGGPAGAFAVTLNDCLVLPRGDGENYGVRWGGPSGPGGAPEALWERLHDATTPPSGRRSRPAWGDYLASCDSLGVQLVTLTGLEPGELLQMRSRDHAADVTAGPDGRATVPVLLPADGTVPRATLVRVNRRPITGDVRLRVAVIEHHLAVPGGRAHRVEDDGRTVRLVVDHGDAPVTVHEFSPGEPLRGPVPAPGAGPAPVRTVRRGAVRQAMEAVARAAVRAHAVRERPEVETAVPGVDHVVAVPGFEAEPVAVALMADGTALLLDLDEDGPGVSRVAGTFEGPVGPLAVHGGWATAVSAGRVDVYRVTRGPSRRVRATRPKDDGGNGSLPGPGA